MTDSNHPTHLSPSELGTKDYWETFYARTLAHLAQKQPQSQSQSQTEQTDTDEARERQGEGDKEGDRDEEEEENVDDDSDPGTSWFSEYNAPDKVLRFLTAEEFPLAPVNTRSGKGTTEGQGKREQPSILDLGTGNGSMLALLRKRGRFRGEMVGVDYSRASVELARRLQALRAHDAYLSDSEDDDEPEDEEEGEGEDGEKEIRFEEWDILRAEGWALADADNGGDRCRVDWFPYGRGGFDIVLDKGTFDAVSLSEEVVEEKQHAGQDGSGKTVQRRVCETYPGIARRTVRKGGFLVVTSCNWTEEELIQWFTRETGEDRLEVWGRVEYPRFRFGGREGQGVVTVCFQRV